MKCVGNEDVVTICANSDEDFAHFKFVNESSDKIVEFKIRLMSIDSENLEIEEIEYEAQIEICSSKFLRIIRDLSTLDEKCDIQVLKDSVAFSIDGETGEAEITIKASEEEETYIEIRDEMTLSFSLRFLSLFSKATPLSHQAKIFISASAPIKIQYVFEDDAGEISFFLAPKLEENDIDE